MRDRQLHITIGNVQVPCRHWSDASHQIVEVEPILVQSDDMDEIGDTRRIEKIDRCLALPFEDLLGDEFGRGE